MSLFEMNRSFENIFEKHNITSGPRFKKHHMSKCSTRSHGDRNSQVNLNKRKLVSGDSSMAGNLPNLNSSYSINKNLRGKYYQPTRYETLEIVRVDNRASRINCSLKESAHVVEGKTAPCDLQPNNGVSLNKEHKNNEVEYAKNSTTIASNLDMVKCSEIDSTVVAGGCTENLLWDNFNINDATSEPIQIYPNNITEIPESKDMPTPKQHIDNTSNELDLLIDLIKAEDENKNLGENERSQDLSDSDDNVPLIKERLKGGCEEMFYAALRRERVKSSYLKYDKRMGLRIGQLLTVVNIEAAYGFTLAIVKSPSVEKNFAVSVLPEMAPRLQIGAQIEAFFDDQCIPYKLQHNGELIDVYLEPYKLLIE